MFFYALPSRTFASSIISNLYASFSMTKIAVWLAPNHLEHPEQVLAQFPEAARKRIAAYPIPAGQRSRICSQLLLIKAVREVMPDVSGVLEDIVRLEGEKPFFKTIGLHFSLSHSHDWIALALSDMRPVGIDIEYIEPQQGDHLSDYLHAAEKKELTKLDATLIPQKIISCWTQKEAALKAVGKKIYEVPLQSINTLEEVLSIPPHQVHCSLLKALPDYSIALATTCSFAYEIRFTELQEP